MDMKNKIVDVCYKYKDGRFLKQDYIGDGDYELVLTKELKRRCWFPINCSLSDILRLCDGVYDDNGEHITTIINESDFEAYTKENEMVFGERFTKDEKSFIDFILKSLQNTTSENEKYKLIGKLLDEFNLPQGFY